MVLLKKFWEEMSPLIEGQLQQLLLHEESPCPTLFEAAHYSLFSGGKRIRPLLVLATAHTFGGDTKRALAAACALELLHTYSLIHDDLPCMDNDDFRRGRPTLHRVYPEWEALLTGDFLLTYTFQVLSEIPDLLPEQKLRLIALLSHHAGAHGMVAGQVLDLMPRNDSFTLDQLKQLHRLKTGELLTAALEFGGIIAEVSEDFLLILRQVGEKIGLAFQIVDDLLDVTAGDKKHGRASDAANQRVTYFSFFGEEGCRQQAELLLSEVIELLALLPADCSLLVELARFIVYRDY